MSAFCKDYMNLSAFPFRPLSVKALQLDFPSPPFAESASQRHTRLHYWQTEWYFSVFAYWTFLLSLLKSLLRNLKSLVFMVLLSRFFSCLPDHSTVRSFSSSSSCHVWCVGSGSHLLVKADCKPREPVDVMLVPWNSLWWSLHHGNWQVRKCSPLLP